jgi:hypothetical protein
MDEESKQEQQNNGGEAGQRGLRPHVQVFGMDVNMAGKHDNKEDWRARKDEWKQKHHEHIAEQREQWKAQRHDWHHDHDHDHHHEGGLFFGMVVLFAGVVALLYTMGLVSHAFWHAIVPFWPILLILWGVSIILGRHWFARFIMFLLTLVFLVAVILYGLVKTDSPVVSSLSPTVVSAIQSTHTQY